VSEDLLYLQSTVAMELILRQADRTASEGSWPVVVMVSVRFGWLADVEALLRLAVIVSPVYIAEHQPLELGRARSGP
jgi:hypothetical protein